MSLQEVANSPTILTLHTFIRIGLPILMVFIILEIVQSPPQQYFDLLVFLIAPQSVLLLFLTAAGSIPRTPKVLVFREDGVLVTTRKGWFPLVTPSETFLIKYDMIRRVYEGSLTKRPAFVLVGARVLIGNWEERYLVTGRVAHLLRKNWEAHKLGHAMQYEM